MQRLLPLIYILLLGGAPASGADSWSKLQHAARQVRTISADFVQHKLLAILARPIESRGKFYFKAPGSIRWEYVAPIHTVSLLHRGKTRRFVRSPSTKRLVQDASVNVEAMQVVLDRISRWLGARFDKDPSFVAKLEQGAPSRVILTPRQRSIAKIIKRMELSLSSQTGVVNQVKIIETDENSATVIRFENIRLNQQMGDRLFESPERSR